MNYDHYQAFRDTLHQRDRRTFWAADYRDQVPYEKLSRGEKKVRHAFYHMTHPAPGEPIITPVQAVVKALRLELGPVPELQSKEEFAKYWTLERIQSIADRWTGHPSTRPFAHIEARNIVKSTESHVATEIMRVAAKLVEEAFDPENKATDRIKAQLGLLKIAGVGKSRPAPPGPPVTLPTNFRENHATIVPRLFEQCAQDPNVNRGRLRQEGLRWMLSKAMPEVYGDKMDINVQSTFNVVNVLANVKRRRQLAEERMRRTLDPALNPEDDILSPLSIEDLLGSGD